MTNGKLALLALSGVISTLAFGEPAHVEVNATRLGRTIPNTSQVLTVWDGVKTDWSLPDNRDYPTRGFVRYVEMMSCTGGNAERDLFRDPSNRAVLDDYDFTRLVDACRGILAHGAKPYLKLGNVPAKFTADYDGGSFKSNIRPPTDHRVHYRYMKACAAALKAAFGREEVRSWRFAVLTEADNIHWFRAKSQVKAESREEFFKLYDFAAKAFEEELGMGLAFGTHLLYPGDSCISQFTLEDVIAHCAAGTNAATGGIGAPLGLLTISYYGTPDKDDLTQGRMRGLKEAVDRAHAAGFAGLVTGVDEGRVIFATPGRDRKDICSRAVGASYEAAFDLRVVLGVLDAGSDYFATWGYFSGPCMFYEGLPSHHYFACREFARFAGMRRAEATVKGTPPGHEELDALAGVSADGTDVRIAVGRFRDRLVFTNRLETTVSVRLPKAFAGRTVDVDVLTLDDRSNWFVDWERDRVQNGISAQDFSWSPDDFAVLSGRVLTTPRFRTLFAEKLQPAYARKAAGVKPVRRSLTVGAEGLLTVPLDFVGNGAAFASIR